MPTTRRFPRLILCAWVVLLLLGLPRPIRAQQTDVTLTVTPAFEGNYAPGGWLPLIIEAANTGATVDGQLVAGTPEAPQQQALPISLPPGSRKLVTLYLPLDQRVDKVRVALEQNGVTVAERMVEVRPRQGERLLGVLGGELLALPRRQDLTTQLPFVQFAMTPATLPAQPAGLRSLTFLAVLNDPSDALNVTQRQALLGWLAGGGQLVVGLNAQPLMQALALAPPLRALEAPIVLDEAAFEEWAGSAPPDQITGAILDIPPGATAFGPATAPLWTVQRVGEGRVIQLAFDPGGEVFAAWADGPNFWERLLQPAVLLTTPFGTELSLESSREQVLTGAVGQLPPINLPTTTPLIALLVVYVLVVGPGLAWWLRRRRQESRGWLLIPATVVLFTVSGGAIAWAVQPDQRVVAQVELVEQVAPGLARARTVTALLAPRPNSFAFTLPEAALVRPLRSGQGPYGPISGTLDLVVQGATAAQVAVAPWELRGLIAESQIVAPALEAVVTATSGAVLARVRNNGSQPARDVVVAYQDYVAQLGDLAPGETHEVPLVGEGTNSVGLSTVLFGSVDAERPSDRSTLARAALVNAAVTRGPLSPASGPFVLAWYDQSLQNVGVATSGAATQTTTLFVGAVQLAGSGAINLPTGWLTPNVELEPNQGCFLTGTDGGSGFIAASDPFTATLALPPGFTALQATALTLTLDSDRTWPNAGLTTELWDWQRQRWVDQNYDGPGSLVVNTPGAYLQDGRLRLRLRGRATETGCVSIRSRVEGTLP